MNRPLYRGSETAANNGNLGLWYDKFCDQWKSNFTGLGGEEKQAWIASVTIHPAGEGPLLEEHARRIRNLVTDQAGSLLVVKTDGPFVTGLGREHPVENGFAWHHLLGVPYLPGSSVKGLVRSWLRDWLDIDTQEVNRIFGDCGEIGKVVFLDALPVAPVQLKKEVLTPHYGQWPQDASDIPGDWHSPVPIPFLAVDEGQSFQFALVPASPEWQEDCAKVSGWLREALEMIGAGAKNAIGFGRFAVDVAMQQKFEQTRAREEQEAEKNRRLQEETAGRSAIAKELIGAAHEGNWQVDKDAFSAPGIIEGWLERLEVDTDQDAIRYMQGLMEKHYAKVLADPDRMKKGKYVFKERQRAFALRMRKLMEQL